MGDTADILDYNSQVFSLATIPAGSTLGRMLTEARKEKLLSHTVPDGGSGKKRLRTYNSIIKSYFGSNKAILNPADDSHSDIGYEKSVYRPTDKRRSSLISHNPELSVRKKSTARPMSLTSTPQITANPLFTDKEWLKNNRKPMLNGNLTNPAGHTHAALLDFIDENMESPRISEGKHVVATVNECETPQSQVLKSNGQLPQIPSRHNFKVTQVEMRPKSMSFNAAPDGINSFSHGYLSFD